MSPEAHRHDKSMAAMIRLNILNRRAKGISLSTKEDVNTVYATLCLGLEVWGRLADHHVEWFTGEGAFVMGACSNS